MKYTISNASGKTLAKVDGNEIDMAMQVAELARQEEGGSKTYFAECIATYQENMMDDAGTETSWEDIVETVASDILHCNAPFVFNGRKKQILIFELETYIALEEMVRKEAEVYFNGVKDEESKEEPQPTSHKVYVKAIFPGVYPAPTKAEPNRFAANGRLNKKTIKIGFYPTSEEAIAAKEEWLKSNEA